MASGGRRKLLVKAAIRVPIRVLVPPPECPWPTRSLCHDQLMLVLVPSDPLDGRRPDDYFSGEVEAALAGGLDVGLIDHDALSSGHAEPAVRRAGGPSADAVYRGWMIRSEHYEELERVLRARDVILRTSAAAYRQSHELPGWYEQFTSVTAPTVWLDRPGITDLWEAARQLPTGAGIVKDWVKSIKHYWEEATYVPDVHDRAGLEAVASRFLELRGNDLVGGVVVRVFESFERGEVRSWWVDGRCQILSSHPDTPGAVPSPGPPVERVERMVDQLTSPFVTVDWARTDQGTWRVVEVGDGQVSDRPADLSAEVFIEVFTRAGGA